MDGKRSDRKPSRTERSKSEKFFRPWSIKRKCTEQCCRRIMEASEDMNETDEVESCFEEESALSESGFEELVCEYNVYIIF